MSLTAPSSPTKMEDSLKENSDTRTIKPHRKPASISKQQIEALKRNAAALEIKDFLAEATSHTEPIKSGYQVPYDPTDMLPNNASLTEQVQETQRLHETSMKELYQVLEGLYDQYVEVCDKYNELSTENSHLYSENERIQSENGRLVAEFNKFSPDKLECSCVKREGGGRGTRRVAAQWRMG